MKYILIIALLFNVSSAQSLFGVVASDGFDADARRYLDSAGITNSSQRSAFNTFVKGMKSNGLWTKAAAIYPFMGTTASSQKWNAKDVRDLDAAYRLTFVNSATHDANGVTFNGTTQYAQTYLTASSVQTDNNNAILIYNRTNNSGSITDIGARSTRVSGGERITAIYAKLGDGKAYAYNQNLSLEFSATNTDASGLYINTRTSSTSFKVFRNGTQLGSTISTSNTETLPVASYTIGALNWAGTGLFNYSNRNYCFAVIFTSGLSDSEASTASSLINTLQTALGRNTY